MNESEMVPGEVLTQTIAGLYRELLHGMKAGEPTWITTGGPGSALTGSISDLSAEQASRDLDGTTIAAHVEHVRWALQLVNDYFDGQEPTADWSASWSVTTVSPGQWDRLREDLQRTGDRLLENLNTRQRWNEGMSMQGALASFAHLAYHLGAVMQMRKRAVQERE